MKKLSFLLICLGLLFSVNSQTLNRFLWQLQNPLIESSSEVIVFNGLEICYSVIDLSTYQAVITTGTYAIEGDKLTLNFENKKNLVFTITWKTPNKIILTDKYTKLILARSGSDEDNFMQNYLLWDSREFREPFSMNFIQSFLGSPRGYETCYTCRGSGNCKTCRGSGLYSHIISSICPTCGGTGKCSHCYGNGIQ